MYQNVCLKMADVTYVGLNELKVFVTFIESELSFTFLFPLLTLNYSCLVLIHSSLSTTSASSLPYCMIRSTLNQFTITTHNQPTSPHILFPNIQNLHQYPVLALLLTTFLLSHKIQWSILNHIPLHWKAIDNKWYLMLKNVGLWEEPRDHYIESRTTIRVGLWEVNWIQWLLNRPDRKSVV